MILVDTSVWVDHLRAGEATLVQLLEGSAVLGHPWVTGEVALGGLHRRGEVISLLRGLPPAVVADHDEVLGLIEQEAMYGAGIGYVDAQLLAATKLTPGARLWTRDKRLRAVAARLELDFGIGAWPRPRATRRRRMASPHAGGSRPTVPTAPQRRRR